LAQQKGERGREGERGEGGRSVSRVGTTFIQKAKLERKEQRAKEKKRVLMLSSF
jgi:hypothetical protein